MPTVWFNPHRNLATTASISSPFGPQYCLVLSPSARGQVEYRAMTIPASGGLMALVRQHETPYVINFAAQSMVAESWQNPGDWFTTNAVSTVKLHDELRKCEFLKRYVHVSTPEVYGSCSGFVDHHFIAVRAAVRPLLSREHR